MRTRWRYQSVSHWGMFPVMVVQISVAELLRMATVHNHRDGVLCPACGCRGNGEG